MSMLSTLCIMGKLDLETKYSWNCFVVNIFGASLGYLSGLRTIIGQSFGKWRRAVCYKNDGFVIRVLYWYKGVFIQWGTEAG